MLDKAKPGKNPCRSAYDGHPLTRQEVQVHALQDLDITEVWMDRGFGACK